MGDASDVREGALVERMLQLSTAYIDARAIWVVAKLGIADLLAEGPRSVADLARARSVDPSALHRVLRLAAANGALEETGSGSFRLTALGDLLKTGSMRDWVLWCGGPLHECFRDALEACTTGQPVFERVHGAPLYEYLRTHPDDARTLSGAMTTYGRDAVAALTSFDFRGANATTIVDIGAGSGALDIAVLHQHPRMRATLFDLPHVVPQMQQAVKEARVDERVDIVAGDFFQSVPDGGDVYVLSAVLRNWNDEQCVTILTNVRRAMKRGKLLVIETVIPPNNAPHVAKKSDVVMLVALGGLERTLQDYSRLFGEAGFRLTEVHSTSGLMQVVEAEPV
jgi:precorrin-6B methylase 2